MNFESDFNLKNRGIDSSQWFIPNTEFGGFMLYGEFDCFTDKGGVCVGINPEGDKLWIGHYKKGRMNGYCEVLMGGDWEGTYIKGDFLNDELHGQGEWKTVNEKEKRNYTKKGEFKNHCLFTGSITGDIGDYKDHCIEFKEGKGFGGF